MINKRLISLLTFLLLISARLIAQYADCKSMLVLNDTIYQTQGISGYGNVKEFEGNELTDTTVFEQEKNSIWYLITAPSSGLFTFDIITQNKRDDWDFLLYEHKKKFCKRIEDKKIVPIRSNLSRSSTTGLSLSAQENFVGAGINNNYSKPVTLEKGQQLVLVVNNSKRSGSKHTLLLHFFKEKELEEKEKDSIAASLEETAKAAALSADTVRSNTKLELVVKDKLTKELVSSNIEITGLGRSSVTVNDNSSYTKYLSRKNREIDISISAKGYMLYVNHFAISKNATKFLFELLLEPIVVGSRVNLTQIQFYGNRHNMLPSSKPSLETLLSFMKLNPTVFIEVEGHVNGPGQKNSKDYKKLSYNRAYAVKEFLEKHGIDKKRIDFKGYGNSTMLYPSPKSAYQEAANRRVEIKIISK